MAYDERVLREIETYAEVENIHALPRIYHYWSGRFVLPAAAEVFGDRSFLTVYTSAIRQSAPSGGAKIFSIGCGYGEVEIRIAEALIAGGYHDFHFTCADLSPVLIDRFREALPAHLSGRFEPVVCDVNAIDLDGTFDCMMAHHSLHHIVNLEHVFDWVHAHLADHGVFATCDMIGRNGHMRWPEVEVALQALWPLLPERQRTNRQLRRVEDRFINHDCSLEGFEGIRAQDILPVLLQRFHPSRFLGYGGIIDPFIDRGFGHNFNPDDSRDVAFINAAAVLTDVLLDSGATTPTAMFAQFTKAQTEQVYFRNRSAERSVRAPWIRPEWAHQLMETI